MAERYREEQDPQRYEQVAWRVVRQLFLNRLQYQFALSQARAASELAPNSGACLTSIGLAHCGLGQYAEALATLMQAEPLNQSKPSEQLADLAFLAMAHHRLGHKAEATAALDRLRERMKQPPVNTEDAALAFLAEAEALLQAPAAGEK